MFQTTIIDNSYANVYAIALEKCLTTIFRCGLNENMVEPASFPIWEGGIELNIFSKKYCQQQLGNSKLMSGNVVNYILNGADLDLSTKQGLFKQMIARKKLLLDQECPSFITKVEPDHHQRFEEMSANGDNYWLNRIPVKWRTRWKVCKTKFNDALRSASTPYPAIPI